mgnify:CR=1 FL=1
MLIPARRIFGQTLRDDACQRGRNIGAGGFNGEGIVVEVWGGGRAEPRAAVERADGSDKPAIVMVRKRADKNEAKRMLGGAGGFVRPVIGDPPAVKS